jgi:hypothetical protein
MQLRRADIDHAARRREASRIATHGKVLVEHATADQQHNYRGDDQ